MSSSSKDNYLHTLYEGKVDFDTERFLTEVESQFGSDDIVSEVRSRLDVIKELRNLPEMSEASTALRDQLTRIFTTTNNEAAILNSLRDLTEVQGADGKKVNLRSFLKREKKTLTSDEYRIMLAKKIENTRTHVINLTAYYPDGVKALNKLSKNLDALVGKINDPSNKISDIRDMEGKVRESNFFLDYEDMKSRFLKDWLKKFGVADEGELANMNPAEIQSLIQEHHRHQMTTLLKSKIKLLDTDMTEHLGLHDTMEGDFKDVEFWRGANVGSKNGFKHWVLGVVQAFGMIKGQRYAFFQSEDHPEQYLLFGLGLSSLETIDSDTIRLVPYLKPFTSKGNYLLEVRNREIGDTEQYKNDLLHYTLPFLFAFDQMKEFDVSKELVSFFTSNY